MVVIYNIIIRYTKTRCPGGDNFRFSGSLWLGDGASITVGHTYSL